MHFSSPAADLHIPDGTEPDAAFRRVTHLCIAAHQDDIEIMAHAAISDCIDDPNCGFGGVVVADGAGSPRSGPFAHFTDAQMVETRRAEQRIAATLGRYAVQVQLAHPSAAVKSRNESVVADIEKILLATRARFVFLHSPADKHDTHVAVLARSIEALRRLPPDRRPERVLGCEVWRDLDWLDDDAKIALDSGRHPQLAQKLIAAFASQIVGGKRYDAATLGRRMANATFQTPRATDAFEGITWAMDLTPAIAPGGQSLEEIATHHIRRFEKDVRTRLRKFC